MANGMIDVTFATYEKDPRTVMEDVARFPFEVLRFKSGAMRPRQPAELSAVPPYYFVRSES
jgi:hypothetical protein